MGIRVAIFLGTIGAIGLIVQYIYRLWKKKRSR